MKCLRLVFYNYTSAPPQFSKIVLSTSQTFFKFISQKLYMDKAGRRFENRNRLNGKSDLNNSKTN